MGRSTITVSSDAKDRFDSFKRDDETVEAAFLRLLDTADGEFSGGDSVIPDDVLTESHIDDIAAAVAPKAADELEGRLR